MNQRKDSATINFRNLISNEEKYIEKVEFQISSDKFIIPLYQLIKYTQIQQYSNGFMEVIEEFSRKLTKQQSQGKLKTKSISLFFDLIQEESVTITSDEYWDLFRLSKIFNSVILEEF